MRARIWWMAALWLSAALGAAESTAQSGVFAITGVTIVDGKFLIPGLWDMHVHLMNTEERLEYFPLLFIANGITGVRDMGAALPAPRLREIRTSRRRISTL